MTRRRKLLFLLVLFVVVVVVWWWRVEGFRTVHPGPWTPTSTRTFLELQRTLNRDKIFDVNQIQQTQAGQSEVDYFNRHGHWYWSPETEQRYQYAVAHNPYVNEDLGAATQYAKTIYNENVIQYILNLQGER